MTNIRADPSCARIGLVFGLVLAGMIPPPPALLSFYSRFCILLQEGLKYAGVPSSSYFIYEPEMLHTTVATFRSFLRPPPPNPELFVSEWKGLLMRASRRSGWPVAGTYVLTLYEAKVQDNGVGTFLYVDKLRVIERMRECIRAEMREKLSQTSLRYIECINGDIKIPNIVHSTMLRWRGSPSISRSQLQNVFSEAFVLTKAVEYPVDIPLSSVSLLREWKPYMMKKTCVAQLWPPENKDTN
ncbi:unnamed protein product [Agarophyton chilense]